MKKGITQIYTGNGKGKTTAALGLSLRAIGSGLKVAIIQFLKNNAEPGEIKIIKNKFPEVEIFRCGGQDFITKNNISKEDIQEAEKGLNKTKKLVESKKFDLIILDEINVALFFKLLDCKEIDKMIENKPKKLELVLTGRYAPKEIIELADLVTEMKDIKHPYNNGVQAREGIEF